MLERVNLFEERFSSIVRNGSHWLDIFEENPTKKNRGLVQKSMEKRIQKLTSESTNTTLKVSEVTVALVDAFSTTVTPIDLRCHGIGAEGAVVMAGALSTNITSVDLESGQEIDAEVRFVAAASGDGAVALTSTALALTSNKSRMLKFISCCQCSENVPIIGNDEAEGTEIKLFHLNVGAVTAKEICKKYVLLAQDLMNIVWIGVAALSTRGAGATEIPASSYSQCSQLHILHTCESGIELLEHLRILNVYTNAAFPLSASFPSYSDCIAAIRSLLSSICGASVSFTDSYLIVSCNVVDIWSVEKIVCDALSCNFACSQDIVSVLGSRACLEVENLHTRGGRMIGIGGGNGTKTFGTAQFLGWDASQVINWEVEGSYTHPHIRTEVHTHSSPFISSRITLEPSSVSLAMAIHSLHHVDSEENLFKLLSKLRDVVMVNGLVVLKEHDCSLDLQSDLGEFLMEMHAVKDRIKFHLTRPLLLKSRCEWIRIFEKFGFRRLNPTSGETIINEESNPNNKGLDPASTLHASFYDVFIRVDGLFMGQSIPSQDRVNAQWHSHLVQNRPDCFYRRLLLKQAPPPAVGFSVPRGKWRYMCEHWFHHAETGFVWVDRDKCSPHRVIIASRDFAPRSYTGRLLESPLCTARLFSRVETQKILSLLPDRLTSNVFFIPPTVCVEDGESFTWSELRQIVGFPAVCKFNDQVKLCPGAGSEILLKAPCTVQGWVETDCVIKLHVVGDSITCSLRQTVSITDIDPSNLLFPRISASPPGEKFTNNFSDSIFPSERDRIELCQELRKAFGVHLFNVDLLPVHGKFAIIDINHFPGYKDVPNMEDKLNDIALKCLNWVYPRFLVLVGPPGTKAVGVELANRFQLPLTYISVSFPSEVCEMEFRRGVYVIESSSIPSRYFQFTNVSKGVDLVQASTIFRFNHRKTDIPNLVEMCLKKEFLYHCRMEPKLKSLPKSLRDVVLDFFDSRIDFAEFVHRFSVFLDDEHGHQRPFFPILNCPLGHAGDIWWNFVSEHRKPDVWDDCCLRCNGEMSSEYGNPASDSTWTPEVSRGRCGSRSENENSFFVIESFDCYERYIRPRLELEPLPMFLADLVKLEHKPDSRVRMSSEGTRLYHCIDVPDGSGWLLSPNPKYLNPLVNHSVADILTAGLTYVAYWVAPVWYTDEFKAKLISIECSKVDTFDFGVEPSTTTKPRDYLHTFRDLVSLEPLKYLQEGARAFFSNVFDIKEGDLIADMHYLPQLKYSTLHVHFRSKKLFDQFELTNRYRLNSLLEERVPISSYSFQYFGKFNSYHGIWQIISEFKIPVNLLKFGPTMMNWGPVLLLGTENACSLTDLVHATMKGGDFPPAMLCSLDSFRVQPEHFHTSIPENISSLTSQPDENDHFFALEAVDAYVGLREAYKATPLPKFLSDIFNGVVSHELRCLSTGERLCHVIVNSDGSGWFISLNVKFHPPHVPLSRQCLKEESNFIAWWVSSVWLSNVVKMVENGAFRECYEFYDPIESVDMSNVSKPEQYLHTIRDCQDPDIFINLLSGVSSFFATLGLGLSEFDMCDTHYPPALKYSTLHVHFRRKFNFALDHQVMRFPVQKLIAALTTNRQLFCEGAIQFLYPHHTGRACHEAFLMGYLKCVVVPYGARTPTTMQRHVIFYTVQPELSGGLLISNLLV